MMLCYLILFRLLALFPFTTNGFLVSNTNSSVSSICTISAIDYSKPFRLDETSGGPLVSESNDPIDIFNGKTVSFKGRQRNVYGI